MKEKEISLDEELRLMALETPEMPEDFHRRWTGAVRAEAAAEKKGNARKQWKYIVSAAAVFVFLIGGTLLTRGQKNPETQAVKRKITATSMARPETEMNFMPLGNEAAVMEEAAMDMEEAEEEAFAAEEAITAEADRAAEEHIPLMAYAYTAGETGEVNGSAAAYGMTAEEETEETGEAAEAAAGEVSEAEEKKAAEAEAEEPAEAAHEEAAAADEAEDDVAADTEAAGRESTSFWQEVGLFLEDMGAFALKALPWMLGAAALAAAGVLIHRAMKRRKE